MIQANISNHDITHTSDFSIIININKPIIGLSVTDFLLQAVDGNGITNIEMPNTLEINYIDNPSQTLCTLPIELPENVIGSFRVCMQSKLYTLDNTKLGLSQDVIVIPNTEQIHILCDLKIFRYNTIGE